MNPSDAEILARLDAIELAEGEHCAALGKLRTERMVLHAELKERMKAVRTGYEEPILSPDISMFKGTTMSLLKEFLKASNYMLSHQDIREDVIGLRPDDDETDADGSALRQIIDRARKNIEKHPGFHYEIINIKGKGYQLVERGTLQNVTNRPKKRRKSKKKRYAA